MRKNQIIRCHLSLLLKTAVLLSDFSKNFERLLLSEKKFFSKIFLHFFIAFESNNGKMLWHIGIFLFGRKVPIWTTLIYTPFPPLVLSWSNQIIRIFSMPLYLLEAKIKQDGFHCIAAYQTMNQYWNIT